MLHVPFHTSQDQFHLIPLDISNVVIIATSSRLGPATNAFSHISHVWLPVEITSTQFQTYNGLLSGIHAKHVRNDEVSQSSLD